MCGLVREVEYGARVDGITHVACFEMEVRTCGAACVSAEGNRGACFYILVGFDKECRKVTVDGFKVVGMA